MQPETAAMAAWQPSQPPYSNAMPHVLQWYACYSPCNSYGMEENNDQ